MAKPTSNAANQPSVEAAQLILRIGLILGFVVTPVALLVSQRAIFVLSSIAAALIFASGIILAPRLRIREVFGFLSSPIGFGCIVTALWAFASLIWTPFPTEATPRLLKIVATFLSIMPLASALPDRSRAANLYILPLGVSAASIGAIFIGAGFASNSEPGENETLLHAVTVALLLVWPAMMAAALRGRATIAASVAIVSATAAVSAHATTALVATGFGALVFTAASADRITTGKWVGLLGAASFALAPLLPLLLGPLIGNESPTALSWLRAWHGILVADGVRMLTGHGFNYVASGYFHGYLGPGTPKSSLFEIWTDLGVLGALANAALVNWLYQFAAAQSEKIAPYWLGALTFITALGVFGGATLQLWWITSLALGFVALILASRGDFQTARPSAPRQND